MTAKSSTHQVQMLHIDDRQEMQRIDNFLQRILKGVPKSHIYRLLRTGQVRVNGGRIQARYKLQAGDKVRLPPVRYRSIEHNAEPPAPPAALATRLQHSVVYRSSDILVINKPSGVAVHGGSGLRYGLIEVLRQQFDDRALQLVHRLDRETSGCLVLARNAPALKALNTAFAEGRVEKRYLALTRGHWDYGEYRLSAAVRKTPHQGGQRRVSVSEQGKSASTLFRPVSISATASLLEVLLDTGRTHQIRVHAAHLDAPLAGDEKYGDRSFNRHMATLGLSRLFLHAHSLFLPLGSREISVNAPLPDDLGTVLDNLKNDGRSARGQH